MNKKSFTTLLCVSVAVGLFIFLFFNGKDYHTPKYLAVSIGVAMLYSYLIGYGNFVMNYFLSKKFSWIDQTRERTIFGIIGAVLVNIILVLACNYVNLILVNNNNPENFFKGSMLVIHLISVNISLLISAILHAKDFMEEWKKSAKSQVTEQKIIAKSANAQFESLKNQLDPHFLFNSLNVLSALIDENPEQALRFTSSMSKIYRYVLDEKDKELVTVEEELEFAKTYCELLKTRFEDSVIFEVEVEEKVRKMFVVPLSLQLLLENAIKHNFATDSKPLVIKIYSENQQLIVENNLQRREIISEREGIGLSNIIQRYSLLTNDRVIIDQSEAYFKIKLPILKEKVSISENSILI